MKMDADEKELLESVERGKWKAAKGGMGAGYRARDQRLDRDVALKILPPAFASDPDRLMRFEREAKTLATLNPSPA